LKVKLLWSRAAKDGLKKKEYIEKTKKLIYSLKVLAHLHKSLQKLMWAGILKQ